MAGVKILMHGDGSYSLHQIHEKIHYIIGAEEVFQQKHRFGNADVWLLVYEKYFFRVNNFATMTILLTQQENAQSAQIVISGSGESMSNVSYGANRQFARECVKALEEAGFTLDKAKSDDLPKGLLERYFKK